jgi:RNA polymerase sigma-B factor
MLVTAALLPADVGTEPDGDLLPAPADRPDVLHLFDRLLEARAAGREVEIARLREELARRHLGLVRYLVRRYANRGEPLEDLAQAGAVGLVKAINRFDPARGVGFAAFAGPNILGEVRRHFRDRTWSVHVTRSMQELVTAVGRAREELTTELGQAPTVAQTAHRIGRSEEDVLSALDCAAAYTAESLSPADDDAAGPQDRLGSTDPGFEDVELRAVLGPLMARLPAREQRILQLRFYGNQTQSEIGAQLGISQMHVSRLLAAALKKLRVGLAED